MVEKLHFNLGHYCKPLNTLHAMTNSYFKMNDSTLDLFCNHDPEIVVDTFSDVLDDRQHMIETMRDTYWNAMGTCADDSRPDDAVSIYEEWCVDGKDPEDINFEFTFIEDLTREED